MKSQEEGAPISSNPITGISVRCARAASGHAAAPPSVARSSRRRRQMFICPSRRHGDRQDSTARACESLERPSDPARRARATGRRLRVTLWSHAVTLRSHIILPGYACATGALDGCQGGPIQRSIAIDRPAVTAAGASASGPGRRASTGALSAAIQQEREPQARTSRRPCGRVPHPPFGDTCGEKAFVSQCAAEAPFGDNQRKLFCDFNESISIIPYGEFSPVRLEG